MSLIAADNLTLGYDNQIVAQGINFSVERGNYLCIVGENGSGKSTLMKTILGLQNPISGKIVYGDSLKQNEIGYLPQQTVVQKDFPAKVKEIVLSGCQGRRGLSPFYSKEDKTLAEDNMKRLGIFEMKEKCYRELSGGQQQRVLLARALCATSKVILLDEPVSGLDPKVTAELYNLIENLNQEGVTVIMISHDVSAAIKYSSHILHVGQSIFFGSREEYLESEEGKLFTIGCKEASSNVTIGEERKEEQSVQ